MTFNTQFASPRLLSKKYLDPQTTHNNGLLPSPQIMGYFPVLWVQVPLHNCLRLILQWPGAKQEGFSLKPAALRWFYHRTTTANRTTIRCAVAIPLGIVLWGILQGPASQRGIGLSMPTKSGPPIFRNPLQFKWVCVNIGGRQDLVTFSWVPFNLSRAPAAS